MFCYDQKGGFPKFSRHRTSEHLQEVIVNLASTDALIVNPIHWLQIPRHDGWHFEPDEATYSKQCHLLIRSIRCIKHVEDNLNLLPAGREALPTST